MAEYCRCGRQAVQRTAWTESNAGRRFVGCVGGRSGCNYFRWIDEPMCLQGRVVIYGLRERVRALEEEMAQNASLREEALEAPRQEHSYWFYVCALCLFVLVIVLCNSNDEDN
ncbi:hypothetical protein DCAR_0520210 [Daucus carota subsp. sativus]|uniref:GRF-type domain-containing protein n=1 Tax=Daucus carota subsp. sativus TaxID=79200 RepID=A0AAF0X5S5_DAUCS|nr:hypothetical protein DCAR_0520210 [Daucus carota subsp. sativus]